MCHTARNCAAKRSKCYSSTLFQFRQSHVHPRVCRTLFFRVLVLFCSLQCSRHVATDIDCANARCPKAHVVSNRLISSIFTFYEPNTRVPISVLYVEDRLIADGDNDVIGTGHLSHQKSFRILSMNDTSFFASFIRMF